MDELPNTIRCHPGAGAGDYECEVRPLGDGLELTFLGPRGGVREYVFEPIDARLLLDAISEILSTED